MIGWTARNKKHESRKYVLDGYKQKHAAIFMPGWDEEAGQSGQDVRLALETGALDPNLPLIVVERNVEWAKLIERDLLTLGFRRLIVHAGELCDLQIDQPVDFVFIDLLGTLDYDLCVWMRDVLSPRLVEGATVALTLAYSIRNNPFMAMAAKALNTHFPEHVGEMREAYRVSTRNNLIPIILFRASLNRHLFAYRKMMTYRDTNFRMNTYKFVKSVFLEGSNGSPMLDDLVSRFTIKEIKAMTTKHRDAALKAWDTRRDNMKKAKRSEAAKKAWGTRRKLASDDRNILVQSEAQRRSAAAIKAWKTRRMNGWVHPANRSPS